MSSTPDLVGRFEEKELHLLKCAIQFFFRHIRFDESTVSRMADNEVFQQFDEREYHYSKNKVVDRVLIDSVYETTETHVATFILAILHQGLFSVTSLIIAIIYLSRFKELSRVSLHTYTWRLLFLTSLLVADKANEDRPIKNGSLVRLFPIVTAEELNQLELTMLLKVRFSICIKSDLFFSFTEKLVKESVSVEINAIVSNSDFATQQLLPSMRTLPCTPEPLHTGSFPKQPRARQYIFPSAATRSRSKQPQMYIQNLMETPSGMSQGSPFISLESSGILRRGRSPSERKSRSPSVLEENSLEYSRTSSRRLSTGRPAHVPPPPVFEPFKFQGHPRRFSIGRHVDSTPMSTLRAGSPLSRSFLSNSRGPRWNTLF